MSLPTKPQSRAGMPPRKARVLLGAAAKVGKTSLLGAWAPQTTLIVDTHHGTELLEGEHYVAHVRDWPGFVGIVNDLVRTRHQFQTIGLDLVGDLWRMADFHFGTTKDGLKTPASATNDYGRSSSKARAAFEVELGRLLSAPVGIWFIAHLREKTDKEGQLVVYAPDMDKAVHGYIMGAVDFVWLAETQPNGRRVVHTQPTPHFEAGSRVALPSPLPMDAAEIARAMDRALNPQDYDEQGNRKMAEPKPVPVEPSEVPVESAPPVEKDAQSTGVSDVTPSDPWVEGIKDRAGAFRLELCEVVTSLGGTVPENVSSWGRVLSALDSAQRRAFERWLTSREEQKADVPWTPEDAAVEVLNRVAEEAPDQLTIKETEAGKP